MASVPRRPEVLYPIPLWISDAEVAHLLGVHRATIWRWLDRGLIPEPRRVGGRTRWSRADILLFCQCESLAEYRRVRQKAASSRGQT